MQTQITYPAGPIDTLSPVLSFISTPHEAVQAELSGALEWSSWCCGPGAFRLNLPPLSSGKDYSLRVVFRTPEDGGIGLNGFIHDSEVSRRAPRKPRGCRMGHR